MRIAAFSDVHANVHALTAILADIDGQKVDRTYCLGDLVGYGAYPYEVVELIRGRGISTIMGNYDDGVGFERDQCGCSYTDPEMRQLGELSFVWTKVHVTIENKAFLRSLLPNIRLNVEGRRVLMVHGSPRRINEYLYEDRGQSTLGRIAVAADSDVLVFGHTHLPYIKEIAGVIFVNTGSTGKPKDGDVRGAYAILDIGSEVRSTIRRVQYDVAAAATAVRESGLPIHFAELLETASG